jgi:transcription elongation factor GreA
MSDAIPMTREGYNKLKSEAERLEKEEMPLILERLANARAEGDLKENAEYHGARESQGMLQAKINDLNAKLSRATIIDPADMPKGEIRFGATIVVEDLEMGDEDEYTLVGAGEEDYLEGKILVTSPLAQGFLGKKVGDVAEIQVPAGVRKYKVLKVDYGE